MLRRLHPRCSLWLNAALALACAAAFLLVLLWPLRSLSAGAEYSPEERSLMEALESGELIRLHVLADGDDAESQRIYELFMARLDEMYDAPEFDDD